MTKIYYLKAVEKDPQKHDKMLLRANSPDLEGRIVELTAEEFNEHWVKLPVEEPEEKCLDDLFGEYNRSETNPIATPKMQKWLQEVGSCHTSMSVGDMIKREGRFFICDNYGWNEVKVEAGA